jgi:hypothetical protein
MGVSTNAMIGYGFVFEDGQQFPWEEKDMDMENWWRCENGFSPSFYPFASGNYKPGLNRSSPEVQKYFDELREFDKQNPLPFIFDNYCHGDYPMHIIVVPSSRKVAYRGDPVKFDPNHVMHLDQDELKKIVDFLKKYDLFDKCLEGWWLYSYWS